MPAKIFQMAQRTGHASPPLLLEEICRNLSASLSGQTARAITRRLSQYPGDTRNDQVIALTRILHDEYGLECVSEPDWRDFRSQQRDFRENPR
jgi:hypothetical protein